MSDRVAVAASTGDRLKALEALVVSLVEAIPKAEVPAVPALAARLVDVLKRIGGDDPSALLWVRDGLALAVDRLVAIQGATDDLGKPLPEASSLAPTVRQLVLAVEAIAVLPAKGVGHVEGAVTIADAKRRRADRQAVAAAGASAGARGHKRRG